MDFNRDRTVGPLNQTVESQGSVELQKDADGMAWVQLANGTLDDITYGGRRKGDGSWFGWSPVAAETINGNNQVIWMHSRGDLSLWSVDSNWNWISDQDLAAGSAEFFAAETSFQMDFNGDGTAGIV